MIACQSCVDLDSESGSSPTLFLYVWYLSNICQCYVWKYWLLFFSWMLKQQEWSHLPFVCFLSRTEGIKTWYFFLIFDGWQTTYTTICLQCSTLSEFFWISVNQNLVYDFLLFLCDVELQLSSFLKQAWSVENPRVWCSEWLAVTDCFECSYSPNHFLLIVYHMITLSLFRSVFSVCGSKEVLLLQVVFFLGGGEDLWTLIWKLLPQLQYLNQPPDSPESDLIQQQKVFVACDHL